MKKIAGILLFVLLVLGPASVWATPHHAACSDSDNGVMQQAMGDCHGAPCCVMGAPARGPDPAPKQVKRVTSVAEEAPQLHTAIPVEVVDTAGRCGGCPSPAASQTTPILRR